MPCRGVERAVLGGDAVKADRGVLAAPGAPDRQLDLSRNPLRGPDVAPHVRAVYARARIRGDAWW
jgi:hypothetical protein